MEDAKIKVKSLAEVSRAIRRVDPEAAKQLRLVGNDAANLLINRTRPLIARRSGRAQASLKARSTRTSTRVAVGGSRAPYYPWLDFGGQGRIKGHPAERPYIKGGRYLYPTLAKESRDIEQLLQDGIQTVIRSAGLDAD